MDFNEARLHEATLNPYTYAVIFYSLSIVSVDGKQHLREVVFCALIVRKVLREFVTLKIFYFIRALT